MESSTILLSIKPKYVQKIFSGEKNIELRRIKPKKINPGSVVIVYATAPLKTIYGAFRIEGIEKLHTYEIKNQILNLACVTRKEAQEYFIGKSCGYAFYIGPRLKISNRMKRFLFKDNSIVIPPQSFCYINIEQLDLISDEMYF